MPTWQAGGPLHGTIFKTKLRGTITSVSPNNSQPVFAAIAWRLPDRHYAATLNGSDSAFLQGAAIPWIEPGHAKLPGDAAQVEVGSASGRKIHEVELSAFGEAVPRVVVLRIPDQLVGVLHIPERDPLRAEKIKCDPSVVPGLVAAAKIL